MSRFKLGRRALLRGFAGGVGVSIGLPMLEIMLDSRAYAQTAAAAKAFGVFFWANGIRKERWTPSTTGPGWMPSEELMPLSALRGDVNVITGTEVKDSRFGHHCATVGILSGVPAIDQHTLPGGENERTTFAAPSIDVLVARQWQGLTPRRSLELAVLPNRYDEGSTYEQLSHNGPNDVNPAEMSLTRAFDSLFGVQDASAQIRAARASVLDVVQADAQALRSRLGTADRARIDQHLENVRALELQIQSSGGATSCTAPARPADLSSTRANIVARFRSMSDMIAIALACDITRVFSISLSRPADNTVYPLTNMGTGMHDLTHNEGGDQPDVHRCVVFAMEQFAYLVNRLKSQTLPTGGNLLDRSCLLATSDCQLGWSHDNTDFPILLAGRAGGALKTGIHYRSTTGESSTKALITIQQALGMSVNTFGSGSLQATGPIPGLLV